MKFNRIYIIISFLITTFQLHPYQRGSHYNHFDVMTNFSYPMLQAEAVRHDIIQGLYFLQQSTPGSDDSRRALDMLEQADGKSITSDDMTSDDQDALQNLLDQIATLIESLEDDDDYRSHLSDICSRLQNKL